MRQKPDQYQYQKITTTTTTRTVRNNPVNISSSTEVKKGKIDLNMLKNKNVEFYKCNKCGKLKFRLDVKQTTHETGSVSRKTEITEKSRTTIVDKSYEKYAKYNVAAKTICSVCGNEKMKCKCNKNRSTSVSTTLNKRSDNMSGPMDLTPKVKVDLNPEKIRKAVEEQRRIREEEKRRKEKTSIKTEETTKTYTKEENYTYDKKKEREIHDEDLCHCGDENCAHNEEIAKNKREEDMMKKRR